MITAAQQAAQANRGTLFVEDGEVLRIDRHPASQFVMRIRAPRCAAAARPGSFVHVTCDDDLPMRRPLSIMRANDDWIEVLYKIVGQGLRQLSRRRVGDTVSVLGPIGVPFATTPERPAALLIGGGVGIPPMVFLADVLRHDTRYRPLAILGSEIPFPFASEKSRFAAPWLGDDADHTMPLLEDWGIPCRLASRAGLDGAFDGFVTDVACRWLAGADAAERAQTEIFACGPTPMLRAVAELAAAFDLPCQVSLEEFMACAVGGCAGCTVEIRTPDGPAMKRVCVDGPVFDARDVAW